MSLSWRAQNLLNKLTELGLCSFILPCKHLYIFVQPNRVSQMHIRTVFAADRPSCHCNDYFVLHSVLIFADLQTIFSLLLVHHLFNYDSTNPFYIVYLKNDERHFIIPTFQPPRLECSKRLGAAKPF